MLKAHTYTPIIYPSASHTEDRQFRERPCPAPIPGCPMSAWHLLAQARPHDVLHLTSIIIVPGAHRAGEAGEGACNCAL